jgi:DNA-binding NarL/FixJ family response regulator
VVILTSHASASHARQALALGVAGFVSKDFVLDELAQALRSAAIRIHKVFCPSGLHSKPQRGWS